MTPESVRPSSRSEVPGEEEVENWLRLLPEDWAPLQEIRDAAPENLVDTIEDFIKYCLARAFFGASNYARNSMVSLPPIVLRDALFEGGKEAGRKPLREDASALYHKVPFARFLLLSCTSTQSGTLIFRTIYF